MQYLVKEGWINELLPMNYLVEEVWINELPPIVKTSGGSMNKWITSNGISSGGRHIGIIFSW